MTRRTITGRANRNESGLALVEFAFVLVLFVMLIWGIISFGYAWSLKEQMYHAAQEGIRTALVTPSGATDDGTKRTAAYDSAKAKLQSMLDSNDMNFLVVDDNADVDPGKNPTITAGGQPIYKECQKSGGGTEAGSKCMTLKISYDWKSHPKIAPLPGIFEFFPDHITATVTGKVS